VGDFCQTSVGGVSAIGDVVATPLLAHVASREGEIVVEFVAENCMVVQVQIHSMTSRRWKEEKS